MKQLYFVLLITLVYNSSVWSQQGDLLVIRPTHGEVLVDKSTFETVAEAYLVNMSTDTLAIRWIRTQNDLSDGWSSAICDENSCYGPMVDSIGVFGAPDLMLAPGDSSNLDIHIRPDSLDGEATVTVEAFVINDPNIVASSTVSFYSQPSSNVNQVAASDIRLYPNPTSIYFQVSPTQGVEAVGLYSLLGQEIKRFDYLQDMRYDISDLQSGVYIARMLDQNNQALRTVRLVKE